MHLLLVDGSSYVYRAFHALPKLTRQSDGLEVGALVGFCNMLWRLVVDAEASADAPTHTAVIFDKGRQNFRHALYPQYKGQRGVTPVGLTPQFNLIRRAVEAFGLAMVEKDGFEADDIIATYADQFGAGGIDHVGNVRIVSPDKDLLQLVNDNCGIEVFDPLKGRTIKVSDVIAKWGVPPSKMIDLQALTGDTADNVPGVPTIGPLSAAELLSAHGNLEAILAAAPGMKKSARAANLVRYADQARLSKQLVTLDRAVLGLPNFADLAARPRDWNRLLSFCDEMEFIAFKAKVLKAQEEEKPF